MSLTCWRIISPDGGRALVDAELYLPKAWTGDPERCRVAGVPDEAGFQSKPALALGLLCRDEYAVRSWRWWPTPSR